MPYADPTSPFKGDEIIPPNGYPPIDRHDFKFYPNNVTGVGTGPTTRTAGPGTHNTQVTGVGARPASVGTRPAPVAPPKPAPAPPPSWQPGDAPYIPRGDGWQQIYDPGVGEQVYLNQYDTLNAPGSQEGYNNQLTSSGYFGPGANQGEQAISGLGGQMQTSGLSDAFSGQVAADPYGVAGGMAAAPDLEGYYGNAQRQAFEGMDQQAAAQGAYGSSANMGFKSEAAQNLAVERASKEAQYGLDRAAEMRQWRGQAGDMLSETDRLRLERQKAGVDAYGVAEELGQGRVGLGIDSATAADVAKLKRIELLLGGGETAQTLREGRIGMGLDATMGLGKTVQEASGKLWDDLDEEQRDALQAQWEAYTGGKIFGSSQNDKTKAADQEAAGGFIESLISLFA